MPLRSRSTERRYQVGPTIAVDSTAALYQAVSPEGQPVVLKQYLPGHAEASFAREAAAIGALDHPNIVELNDAGRDAQGSYLVLERVDGPSLAQVQDALARAGRRMPLEVALGIGASVARALDHVHERRLADGQPLGMVHRDLRPENVLLGADGVPKLADFARALLFGHQPPPVRAHGAFPLAPELALGEPGDPRTDLFALGHLLAQLAAGLDLDADLAAIIDRARAQDREQRTRSARELERQLDRFRAARQLPASAQSLARFVTELAIPPLVARSPGPLGGKVLVLAADHLSTAPTAPRRPSQDVPGERRDSGPPRKRRIERLNRGNEARLPRPPSLPRPERAAALAKLALSIRLQRTARWLAQQPGLWLIGGGIGALIVAIGLVLFWSWVGEG